MKLSIEAKTMVFLLVCIAATVFLTQFWHSMPTVTYGNAGVGLIAYPKVVYAGQNACFTVEYLFPSNNLFTSVEITAKSSNVLVSASEKTERGKNSLQRAYCFSANKLDDGNNLVEIRALSTNVFFNVEKKSFAEPQKPEPELKINSIEKEQITFSVSNFDSDKIQPIEIFVNGSLDHRVFPEKTNQDFAEKISLKEGKNTIELKLGEKTISTEAEKQSPAALPVFLGIPLLVIAFCVFAFFVFSKKSFFEKIALSMGAVIIITILLAFVLAHLNLLNIFSFIGAFIAILVIIAWFFRKNFSQTFPKIKYSKVNPVFVLAIAFFFLTPIFFQFFTSTHITYWNGFYERSSATVAESFSIPKTDSLGYFGRGFSAVPGYFLLDAGFSWVTGLVQTQLFALMLLLSVVFLFFAMMFLGDSLGFSNNKKALFALFVVLEGFLAAALAYSPRHIFSLGFFILALGVICRKGEKNWLIAGIALGIMAFIQAPLLLFFPIFYLIVAPKIEWKKAIAAVLLGAFIFFVLFLPTFLQFGMFHQAQSDEWGYLINYNFYYFFTDIFILLLFFVFFYAPDFLRGKIKPGFHGKKLFAGLVFGIAVQFLMTYRWNLLTTINLGLLIAALFPEKSLSDNVVAKLLAIMLLAALVFNLNSATTVNIQEMVAQPIVFLGQNTETNARILTDPMYGHTIPFIANRAVLADLQVEYADEQKLLGAYKFLEDKDYSIISKYSIDYTVNQVDFVHRRAVGEQKAYGIIEFKKFDKIYSNGFIFIHRVRMENLPS